MYRILSASKDAYITNKIINNNFRATDANTGRAGTLDLFKLYDESTLSGSDNPIELSRILIQFNLNPLRELTASHLDISSETFKCYLKLHDIYGGQTTPSNFKVQVFPLSQSFDEGNGRDIVKFQDLDSCNFITASSTTDSVSVWYNTGANMQGLLGSTNIDIISSGNLSDGNGVVNLWKEQTFLTGEEDLYVDVTTIISGTLAEQIPDCGFRISLSGTQETDEKTRFVKRFASRNASNTRIRPKIIVKYDDTILDHHSQFYFDLTGSLFLNNFHRGKLAHILSGAAASQVKGDSCIVLRLVSGSFTQSFTGSQHAMGELYSTGVYSASFAISQFNSTLRDEIVTAGSATFDTYWGSTDYTVGYHTGSLIIKTVERTTFDNMPERLFVNVTNMRSSYLRDEKVRFRTFVKDIDQKIVVKKTPFEDTSEIYSSMFYRVRDFESNEIVIPFDYESSATRLSTDSKGMYFDFHMDSLSPGRIYVFDFIIRDTGPDLVFTNVATKFRVD